MSGGVGAPGQMSLADFMRLYTPTVLPQATPVQSAGLAALGQSQPLDPRSMGFSQGQGQGQGQTQGRGQQGGSLPFLGQGSQGGAAGLQGGGQMQPASGGLQQLLINAMQSNGANGSSNKLADAVGYVPFGTGSFG